MNQDYKELLSTREELQGHDEKQDTRETGVGKEKYNTELIQSQRLQKFNIQYKSIE